MYKVARVAVEKTTPQYDKEFDYLLPPGMTPEPGCRVTVPFGRGNRRRLGLVLELDETADAERLKPSFRWWMRPPYWGRNSAAAALSEGVHLLRLF